MGKIFFIWTICAATLAGNAFNMFGADKPGGTIFSLPSEKNPLPGQRFEYNYGKDVYLVEFRSGNVLYWKGISGVDKGNEATEKIQIQKIGNGIYFIGWVEKSSWTVAQVLDLVNMRVNCFWFLNGKTIPVSGSISRL